MFTEYKRMDSSEGNVWKYIFESSECIAESVLYKYGSFEKRTVICCSVQSGCPVGCTFCGTGKKFVRNLNEDEIIQQIQIVIEDMNINTYKINKFQIMFMSMGEPMLNWDAVEGAIRNLNNNYPNAQLLLSTIGVEDIQVQQKIINLSKEVKMVGLQFSIHEAMDEKRNRLIPFKNKMNLKKIRDYGITWHLATGRYPYLNYCVTHENSSKNEINELKNLFSAMIFNFTFSVVCSKDESMKNVGFREHNYIQSVMNEFLEEGYNCRMFDPAGQDDIGGGCGQLWYVQQWLNNYKCINK